MRPAYAASLAAAVICHALLLFGFKMEIPARPLAISDEPSSVDVSLVEAAPEPTPAEAPPPPQPVSTPEPSATPEPEPTPDMSTPPPVPEQTPVPEIAPASTPEAVRETPAPLPRASRHPRNTGRPAAPSTMESGEHHGAAANGPVGVAVRYRSNPKPDYPEEARRLHQEGVVLLSVEVSAEGLPIDVTLKRSSGSDLLDDAAVRAVKRWTFDPARVGPLPVATRVDVPIRFSLSQ